LFSKPLAQAGPIHVCEYAKVVEDLNVITELKCNKLLNVITFGLKCNKLQSVTTFGLK